jgi:cytosine deaminase/tRNA(adenine34) deaminase
MEQVNDFRIEQFFNEFFKLCNLQQEELPSLTQIFLGEKLLASEFNLVTSTNFSSFHSEILAIQKAQSLLQSRYLNQTLLITSLEPCIMCAGAIVQARISEVWYFTQQTKIPGISSLSLDLIYKLNHFPKLKLIESKKISKKWKEFFDKKRKKIPEHQIKLY